MKNAEAKKSPYSIRQQYWTRRLLAAITAIDGDAGAGGGEEAKEKVQGP